MYRSNLSSLPEHETKRASSTNVSVVMPPELKSEGRYGQRTRVPNASHSDRRLPLLTKTKLQARTSGRASISEGFLTSDAAPKPPSKQTTGSDSSAPDPRRASFPQTKSTGKTLFAGLGKKVTSMVRARLAFQSNRKLREDIRDANTMEEIHKMPKAPRFSSFMSPEAQYAMMMGYEDVLHHQLSRNHPEYRSVLKRNKTPMFNVGIGKLNTEQRNVLVTSPGGRTREQDGGEGDHEPGGRSASDGDDEEENKSKPRKTPVSPSPKPKSSRRRKSRKTVHGIPFDRRLHLTYRIESAMDILDTIRRRHGQPPISPRVRSNSREIAPIRDYNSWTSVWKKEFSKNDHKKIHHEVNV